MTIIETYQQAYAFLFQFIDFSLTHQERVAPERFELERMFALMSLLGNPQQGFPAIHIAGTKGKGSVAAHCAAALRAAGIRTGLYTSPHLADFRERIQVGGELIPEPAFVEGMQAIADVVPQVPGVTSYELQTALALWYFARVDVECAVVEVGMGGRLDSTNILTPLVSVITNISYDHTAILGNTLAAIAGEKGGIIKPGIPVVSAPQDAEALAVLRAIAAEKGAAFILVGDDLPYRRVSASLDGQTFEIHQGQTAIQLSTRLLGSHQVENAVLAYAALLQSRLAGLPVDDASIQAGFARVSWPGRFEVFEGAPTVVLDGAHNRVSAHQLAETVREHFPGRKPALVFGASEDKDIAGMFAELLPLASGLILYQAGHPRAANTADLAALAKKYDCPVTVVGSSDQVFPAAARLAGEDGVILVAGSLYLVGELRQVLIEKWL